MNLSRITRASIGFACAFSVITAQGGCSLFAPKQQAVAIQTSDPQGQIFVDGNVMGTGSASVMLDRNKSHSVLVKGLNGRSGATTINKHISTTGVLDIVGGCIFLVPFLGVLGPGFWELDPDHVSVIVGMADAPGAVALELTNRLDASRRSMQ